ncbi:hypothetical protein ACFLTE_06760, partial [Bacteroidota bacterium]
DQFGENSNKKFTLGTLKEVFHNIKDLPMSKQKDILENTYNAWKGTERQIDDVLVMGVRI